MHTTWRVATDDKNDKSTNVRSTSARLGASWQIATHPRADASGSGWIRRIAGLTTGGRDLVGIEVYDPDSEQSDFFMGPEDERVAAVAELCRKLRTGNHGFEVETPGLVTSLKFYAKIDDDSNIVVTCTMPARDQSQPWQVRPLVRGSLWPGPKPAR